MTINFRVGHIGSAENDSWILNEEHFSAARFYRDRHPLCVNVHRFNTLTGGGGGDLRGSHRIIYLTGNTFTLLC